MPLLTRRPIILPELEGTGARESRRAFSIVLWRALHEESINYDLLDFFDMLNFFLKIKTFYDSKLCGSYLYCVFSDDFETLLDWTISFSGRPSPMFKSFWSLGTSWTRYSHNFINFSLVSFAVLPLDMILQTNSSSFIKLVGLRGISLVPIISCRQDKMTHLLNFSPTLSPKPYFQISCLIFRYYP